jgi:hypothetical protein
VIHLDQAADEAIHLRQEYIGTSLAPVGRVGLLAEWAWQYPALDALAVQRETALGLLAEDGITPAGGCTVRAGTVRLTASRDPDVRQRYELVRDGERIGWAWLSTEPATRGLYAAVTTVQPGLCTGARLGEAVLLVACQMLAGEQP